MIEETGDALSVERVRWIREFNGEFWVGGGLEGLVGGGGCSEEQLWCV